MKLEQVPWVEEPKNNPWSQPTIGYYEPSSNADLRDISEGVKNLPSGLKDQFRSPRALSSLSRVNITTQGVSDRKLWFPQGGGERNKMELNTPVQCSMSL